MAHPRIIVRGLNWLGDAVMSTPAMQRLREAFPSAHIALLTSEKLADLWRFYPHIDDVIAFPQRAGAFEVARRLRSGKYGAALVFPNSPRSALDAFLGGVPRRYGIARPWRNFLLTDVIPAPHEEMPMCKKSASEVRRLITQTPVSSRIRYPQSGHHAFRYLHLTAAFGASNEPCAPRLTVTDNETAEIRKKFGATDTGLLLGFNPGAEYGPAKRWPIERFIETARRIVAHTGGTCWVLGGSADRDLAQCFVQELRGTGVDARSLAGETSLRELCAALKACAVVVTNDTGPMHVAAAVGTPVIVPFGSTSSELTGPDFFEEGKHGVISGDAPCAPCFRRTCPIDLRCLKDVSVDHVTKAALQVLRATRKS